MKIFYEKDVMTAARERVAFVYDEFSTVLVSCSGGKDSTIILELAIEEARKRDRLPVDVLFIDQEAEWQETINYMEYLAARPEIKLWWVQLPFFMDNAASFKTDSVHLWGPGEPWMRPHSEHAITENIFGEYHNKKNPLNDFYEMFNVIQAKIANYQRYAILYGLRVEESVGRKYAMTKSTGGYKQKAWSVDATWKKRKDVEAWRFGPIYDWSAYDVWTAIGKNEWVYNKCYDKQFQYGIPLRSMRVSSLIHGIASAHSLLMLQEIEPETYEALVKRLPGIDTYSKLQEDIRVYKLPPAFASWKEYLDYLIENLCDEKQKAGFQKLFGTPFAKRLATNETVYREFCLMVQANDYLGVRMANLANTISLGKKKEEANGQH